MGSPKGSTLAFFPKIRNPFLGGPHMKTLAFWGLDRGPETTSRAILGTCMWLQLKYGNEKEDELHPPDQRTPSIANFCQPIPA